jgi:hypothetical protein
MSGSGEGFAMRGGQPGAQQGRCGVLGEGPSVGELLDGRLSLVEVEEHEGLFGGGVSE